MNYMPLNPLEPLGLRMADAVALSGMARSTIYLLGAKGEIDLFRDGRTVIVDYDSLRRALRNLPRHQPK
jgi:hypothetical protein